jgi:hypothetical protein
VIGPQRNRPHVAAYWAADFPPVEGVPSAGWVARQLLDFLGYCSLHPTWLAGVVIVVGLALAARWLGVAALASVGCLILAAAVRAYPLSGGRTTVFLLPFVYLGLGAAIGAAADARRGAGTLVRGALAVAGLALALPMLAHGLAAPAAGIVYEETAPLIAALDAERRPNDRVYVYDGAVPAFRFHHPAIDAAITLGGSRTSSRRRADARSATRSSPTSGSTRASSTSARPRAPRSTSSRSRARPTASGTCNSRPRISPTPSG